jgi:hypothetical protein
MSFFNKLKARNELNNNILSSTNPPTTNDTNTIFQKAGSNELNNSLENNKPINDMNNILNISAPIISNNNNNVPNNTNPNIQQAEILQENINKFKKYIEFINNDQHYFINYNTSYEKAKLILDLQNKYSFQELKNNIKLQLSKYKQSKVYSFKTEPENIVVYDTKKNTIVARISIPICIDMELLHDIEFKKLNNIYTKTQLAYNLLLASDYVLDNKLNEFKKLRNKCEIQINNYYIIQYLLNKMRNNNMNNPQYITHTVDDVYNVNKDTVQTLLILKSKRLNNDIITKLISDESDILNEYIKIKEQLRNKSNTEDNTELKSNIKRYLAMKQDIDNKIKKINTIKSKETHTTIYLNKSDLQNLNFKPFNTYANSILTSHTDNETNSNNNLFNVSRYNN